MSLPIICPCPNQTTTGLVAAMMAADPVDFEEMAVEQNRCPETQRLIGSTSLKLAFRQTGAQCLAGDVSTGNFRPIVPLKFRKTFLIIFSMLLTPGGSLVLTNDKKYCYNRTRKIVEKKHNMVSCSRVWPIM